MFRAELHKTVNRRRCTGTHYVRTTPELPWTSHNLPDHCRRPGLIPWSPALYQTNCDLSWPLQTHPNHSRPSMPSPITSVLPVKASQTTPDRLGSLWNPQEYSMPTQIYPSYSINISATPDRQRSFQIHPEPLSPPDHSRPTWNTPGLPTQSQTNSFLFGTLVTTLYSANM